METVCTPTSRSRPGRGWRSCRTFKLPNSLAPLANGGPDRIGEIVRRANDLRCPERERVLAKNPILHDIVRDGQASIVRVFLDTKFGALPKWVDERLSHAKLSEVERWAKRSVTANTLEAVMGKK